jgi:excinuclease UvrABC ATPase subunit
LKEDSRDEPIAIRGARVHNLKGLDCDIPRNRLVVITGPSGSGKSSLAFDTLYAEGQRRYVESLSPWARQFLEQMDRPEVESVTGLSPAIAIEQRTTVAHPRSTVGTVTEIYDHLARAVRDARAAALPALRGADRRAARRRDGRSARRAGAGRRGGDRAPGGPRP